MKWRTDDVIDLEYFLAEDAEKDESQLRARDEKIRADFLPRCLGAHFPGRADARAKIRCWLERRREIEWEKSQAAATPGEIFRQSSAALRWLAGVLGCLVGGGLALSIFRWYGDRPINVTWFFAETVLVQIVVLCGALALVLRPRRRARVRFSLLHSLIAAAFTKLARVGENTFHRMSGEQRARARAGLGALRAKQAIYGPLALWPVLIVTQIFALGFSAGLLVTILSWVRFSELAFGWSSTLADPRQAALVQAVSLPWAWASQARPSVAEIERSRMNPSQKAIELDPDARRAWWPFLCYAILFYGFLPRSALLAWAGWKQRQTLARIPFDHAGCQALLARLGGFAVESGSPGPVLEMREGDGKTASPPAGDFAAGVCIAFAPPEIAASDESLAEKISARLRWRVAQIVRAEIDFLPACAEALDALGALARDAAASRGTLCSAVVIEDWQPPRQAYFSFLQAVRERAGKTAHVAVLLLAADGARNGAVADENARVWRQKIASLGDPYCRVEQEAKS